MSFKNIALDKFECISAYKKPKWLIFIFKNDKIYGANINSGNCPLGKWKFSWKVSNFKNSQNLATSVPHST